MAQNIRHLSPLGEIILARMLALAGAVMNFAPPNAVRLLIDGRRPEPSVSTQS
ncbi:MAG TPA: hypothetical protein VE687_04915 [Stellaceae bacterium]|nr:hypothetical protein [Stellaceae bacterium]